MLNPYEKRSSTEGQWPARPQRKIGLETPLVGRFWGEDKRLVFAPPDWYTTLVALCLVGGGLLALGYWASWRWVPLMEVGMWLGPAVLLSGVWALLSMEYAVFELKARTYSRREGRGLFKRARHGPLSELDAVVVYCENYPFAPQVVVYRTVIHWKHAAVPLLVTERQQTSVPPGAPLNASSGAIVHRAQTYARALGVTLYDNTHFHTPPPQSAI
ncbi:MAG: hypothetical protein WD716_09185 [Fimbriimonadaceae bacterium]